MSKTMTSAVSALALFAVASTSASILTFHIDGLSNFAEMPQDYGDRVIIADDGVFHYEIGAEGTTPNIIVTYPTDSDREPSYWTTGYGDLADVYFEDRDGNGLGEIILSADYGYEVVLLGFDMAAYSSAFSSDPIVNAVRVRGCNSEMLFEQLDASISETTHTSFDFSSNPLQGRELRIQFDSSNLSGRSDDIGLDNIRFAQVEVVPEEMTCPSDVAVPLCVLDVFDVFAYLDLYTANNMIADFTGDGALDIFDVFAFLDEFTAGCDI